MGMSIKDMLQGMDIWIVGFTRLDGYERETLYFRERYVKYGQVVQDWLQGMVILIG